MLHHILLTIDDHVVRSTLCCLFVYGIFLTKLLIKQTCNGDTDIIWDSTVDLSGKTQGIKKFGKYREHTGNFNIWKNTGKR